VTDWLTYCLSVAK